MSGLLFVVVTHFDRREGDRVYRAGEIIRPSEADTIPRGRLKASKKNDGERTERYERRQNERHPGSLAAFSIFFQRESTAREETD